jgi:citrate/tricarballylate utilization protein
MPGDDLVEEASRQLTICNACRYCEAYCPVFPAIEVRREFGKGDVFFLANLCHDCRACYYACMYSPPHEFAVNLPQIMSEVRLESYKAWSWPTLLAGSFRDIRKSIFLAGLSIGLIIALALTLVVPGKLFAVHRGPGSFYAVIPFLMMLLPALGLTLYGGAVWMMGGVRFWKDTEGELPCPMGFRVLAQTAGDILNLKWLRGGGRGCYYPKAHAAQARRLYHSLVYYGFLSATVSTSLAAIYQDILHKLPPYSLTSAPVLFGSIGGVAIIVGVAGLVVLKATSDREPAHSPSLGLDYLFLIILGLTALSGMFTLLFRESSAMGIILTLHLGLVAAFFITVPYGKLVHSLYRSLAILRHHLEQSHRDAQGAEPIS